MSQLQEKISYFQEKQKTIIEKSTELHHLTQQYKAEFKSVFGIADGEQLNVLEIIQAIQKTFDLQSKSVILL